MRWYFKFFPCYAGTGAKVTYIARDWKEMRVELPLSRRTAVEKVVYIRKADLPPSSDKRQK